MTAYNTRYGLAIAKVLASYPLGSKSLIVALEAVVQTAMGRVKEEARDEIAQDTCLGNHLGPGKGLICRQCYDILESGRTPAEPTEAPVSAEETAERDSIRRQVEAMINSPEADE